MNYQVNEVYTLKVLGLVLDTRTEQHYLQLQDEDVDVSIAELPVCPVHRQGIRSLYRYEL